MPRRRPIRTDKPRASYGLHVLDHLSADRVGLTGGQIAVIALLEVHANLLWCSRTILNQPFTACGRSRTDSSANSPINL